MKRQSGFLLLENPGEIGRVEKLLTDTFKTPGYIGHYRVADDNELSQLDEFIRIHRIGEVIFLCKRHPRTNPSLI